jgi:hypothetical protein
MSTLPSEKFVRETVAGFKGLADRIKEVAIEVAKIQGATRNPVDDYMRFEFDDDDKLYAKFEYYCYGDNNEEYVYFPLEYLWTENFVEIEKVRYAAEVAEHIRLTEERKKLEDAEVKRKAAIKERQTYERLKKKFEGLMTDGN